jgi:hypothetical protein
VGQSQRRKPPDVAAAPASCPTIWPTCPCPSDQRDNRKLQTQFVYAAGADATTLKAAGIVAAWLGKQAGYRGTSFTAQIDQLPAGHGIVFATNAQRPPALRHLPAVDVPTLQLVDHPGVPSAKLLLVLGKDSAQLETAAQALAVGRAAFSGDTVTSRRWSCPPCASPTMPRTGSPPTGRCALPSWPAIPGSCSCAAMRSTMR